MRSRSEDRPRPVAQRSSAEQELRLRYLYHDLVLRGKVRISLEAAQKLIGPDRAYHLYGLVRSGARGNR